jgi:hypothetical protein
MGCIVGTGAVLVDSQPETLLEGLLPIDLDNQGIAKLSPPLIMLIAQISCNRIAIAIIDTTGTEAARISRLVHCI